MTREFEGIKTVQCEIQN